MHKSGEWEMTMRNFYKAGLLATAGFGALLAVSPAMAQVAPAAPDAETDTDFSQTEIIVTAGKREERLADVASSVTAISSAQIETLGITRVDDYVGLVPNLFQISQGAPGNSNIVIRGLFTGSAQLTATTAYYLDESALTASGAYAAATFIAPDADLADVERIEVLKGPQSTLYGANALGGVLRVITKKPDLDDFSGSARGDVSFVDGGGTGYAVRGSLNLPIVKDRLAVRINAFHRRDPGYYDNVATGVRNVNSADISGVRVALRWQPTDRLTLDLNGLYQEIDARSIGFEADNQNTLTPAFGSYQYSAFQNLPSRTKYRTVGGTLNYELGVGTITGSVGYSDYDTMVTSDVSAVYAPFAFLLFTPANPVVLFNPGSQIALSTVAASQKTTAEIRFASNRIGPLEFLVGGFYTKEDNFFETNAPIVSPAGAPAPLFDVLIRSPNPATYEEYAVFGNFTFYITDRLDLTGGLRLSNNKQFVDSSTSGLFGLFFPNATYRFRDDAANYLGTLRWRPTDDLNFYLRAASGYRPGGPNIGAVTFAPFQSDSVWNYEAGVKGSLFDNKLNYGIAVYHIDWSNVQLPGLDPVTSSQITTNGGSADVDGFEVELSVQPISGLTLSGAAGYNKTKVKQVAPDVGAVIGAVAGDPFPLTPKWTASAVADYKFDVSETLAANLGASLRYVGGGRNSAFPGAIVSGNATLPDYITLDLRAGVTFDKRYKLTARVENVTNSQGISTYSTTRLFPGQPGVYSNAIRIRPRTFMISVGADF
jgi:iron complex outermembrane recepter protein